MDLSQIKAFLAVAETGSFTKAAKSLHLSQPSISLKVKALEKHLKAALIDRQSNKLKLTEAGEFTHSKLSSIVNDIDSLESYFQNLHTQELSKITIYHEKNLYFFSVTQLLGQVEALFKGSKTIATAQCENQQDIVQHVAKNKYSLGVISNSINQDAIESHTLNTEEFMLLRKRSPSINGDSVDLSSLINEKIWLPEINSDSFNLLQKRIKPLGLEVNDFKNRSHISESIMPQVVENSGDIGIRLCSQTEHLICNQTRINELSTPYGIFLAINKNSDENFIELITKLLAHDTSAQQNIAAPILNKNACKALTKDQIYPYKSSEKLETTINVGIQIRTIQTVVSGRAVQKLGLYESFLNDIDEDSEKNFSVKWNDYKSAAPILSAIKDGQLDIAIIGDYAISHMANNIFKGSTQDIVVVSFVSINPYGSGSNLFARKNTGFKQLESFKNQAIAVPFLSTAHGSLLYNLNKRKILDNTQLVNLNLEHKESDIRPQAKRAVGMACFTPFDHFLEEDNHYQKITDEVSTPFSFYAVVVRKSFATQNPYAVICFLKAMLCSNYWFRSTSSPLQHLSRWTGVSESFVHSILGKRNGKDCHYIPDMTIREDWIKEYTNNIFIDTSTKADQKQTSIMPEIEKDFLNKAMRDLGMLR